MPFTRKERPAASPKWYYMVNCCVCVWGGGICMLVRLVFVGVEVQFELIPLLLL